MVLDSSMWCHGRKVFYEFCIIEGNPTIDTQPELIRLSNEVLFIVFIYSFPFLHCNVDTALVLNSRLLHCWPLTLQY